MRRALFLLALMVSLSVAPMADAQVRDPFEPLIAPEGAAGVVSAPQDDTGAPVEPVAQIPSDRLADTGFDPAPYLVVAYALLAFGTGAIFLSRLRLQPTR